MIEALEQTLTPSVRAWLTQLLTFAREKRRFGNTMAGKITDDEFPLLRSANEQRIRFLEAVLATGEERTLL